MSDPVLDELAREAAADDATVGLILHGSRGAGVARNDSDYDLISVVRDDVYEQRRADERLLEVERRGQARVDRLFQSPARLAWIAEHPDWYTSTYLNVDVVVDKGAVVASALDSIRAAAHERAAARLADYYDAYLTAYSRSLKCWRRGDVLGGRLNAADSANHLVRVLFSAAGQWAPYLDYVNRALPSLEAALGMPAAMISESLVRLLDRGDPAHQQRLEHQVSALPQVMATGYQPDPGVVTARGWDFPEFDGHPPR